MVAQHYVFGVEVDEQTRCAHYHQSFDVIAIKHVCCKRYYPCHLCHEVLADHPAEVRPIERFHESAVLCGVCELELTITDYLATNTCPGCRAEFNPGCKLHRENYFATNYDLR